MDKATSGDLSDAGTRAVDSNPRTSPTLGWEGTHWACIDQPEGVAKIPFALTLLRGERRVRVSAASLEPFIAGARICTRGDRVLGDQVVSVSKQLAGAFLVRGDMSHVLASSTTEVITGSLERYYTRDGPVEVELFVLMPSHMKPPPWLRGTFARMKDARVDADWRYSSGARFLLYVTGNERAPAYKSLQVWVRRGRIALNDHFALCGMGGAGEVQDRPYMLLARFFEQRNGDAPDGCIGPWLPDDDSALVRQRVNERVKAAGTTLVHSGVTLDLLQSFKQPVTEVVESCLLEYDGVSVFALIETGRLNRWLKLKRNVDQVVRLAMAGLHIELLLLLYERATAEMDLRSLAFLVHALALQLPRDKLLADLLPTEMWSANDKDVATLVEQCLVRYMLRRRNPLSTTAAICWALQNEAERISDRRAVDAVYKRFHSLHMALLDELTCSSTFDAQLLEQVLQSEALPQTINEVSPLQTAFEADDFDFVAHPLVDGYLRARWYGKEAQALGSREDLDTVGARNPLVAYTAIRKMGFAGRSGEAWPEMLLTAGCRLWYAYAMTSTAVFHSARGRWILHALCELAFLALFEWQVLSPHMDTRVLRAVHLGLLAFVLGNLLATAQLIVHRFGSLRAIQRYMQSSPWNALGLLVDASLLVLMSLKSAQSLGAGGLPAYTDGDALQMCVSALSVFVWLRVLALAEPVYSSLTPLMAIAHMMSDVVAFLFPMAVVVVGFATVLSGVYGSLVPEYATLSSAMLQLFSSTLGNFDLGQFDDLNEGQRIFGIAVQLIFLLISAVLLMNLLIAIISDGYKPDLVQAETKFKRSMFTNFYQLQVEHNLICSPFNLIVLALRCLGLRSGTRRAVSSGAVLVAALGLLPLDGMDLAEGKADRPTGLGEVPHLIFLLTVYPILMACAWLVFLVYTPFGVWCLLRKAWRRARFEARRAGPLRRKGASDVSFSTLAWKALWLLPWAVSRYTLIAAMLVGWSSLYQWLAKLLFSLLNLFQPYAAMWSRRRRWRRWRRVVPSPAHERAFAGGPLVRPLSDASPEAKRQEDLRERARMLWPLALQLVQQKRKYRYLSEQEVLNALENSEFKDYMGDWGLLREATDRVKNSEPRAPQELAEAQA